MPAWTEVQKQELKRLGLLPDEDLYLDRGPAGSSPLQQVQDAAPIVKGISPGPSTTKFESGTEDTTEKTISKKYGIPEDVQKLAEEMTALRDPYESASFERMKELLAEQKRTQKEYGDVRAEGTPLNWGLITSVADTIFGTKTAPMAQFVESPKEYKKRLKEAVASYRAARGAVSQADIEKIKGHLEILKSIVPAMRPVTTVVSEAGVSQKGPKASIESGVRPSAPPKGPQAKSLPEGAVAKITDWDNAIRDAGNVSEIIKSRANAFGPIQGRLSGLNPYNVSAQDAQATINKMKQVIGKSLEGGVLRKEDEAKYSHILPKLSDEADVAYRKAERFMQEIPKMRNQYIENLGKGGYDVSKFQSAQVPQKVTSELNKKQKSLLPGTVKDGYRYKGGDPGKKENWEKVK